MGAVVESGVEFLEFEVDNFFKIEHSKLHKKAGEGIKTVEFICLSKKNNLLFVEAKTSCPNCMNKEDSARKREKYEEYYTDIVDKFEDSLNLLLAALLDRYGNLVKEGKNLFDKDTYAHIGITFVLIITGAEESWLGGPKAELEMRLLRLRKIWKANVVVLNTQMAQKYRLVRRRVGLSK